MTGGHHIIFIAPSTMEEALKLGFAVFLLIIYTNLLIKISVALMLLRIKRDFWWRLSLWFLIGMCCFVGVCATITQCLQCRPVSGFWNISERLSGKCWSSRVLVNIQYGWYVNFY
jgi:hypothetical protein